MSLTGLFLIVFLVVHCYINSLIWFGKEEFEAAAHFMGSNVIIRTVEVGLFAFLILHTVQGFNLFLSNRKKRGSRYAVNAANKNSKWYSRSMGILGSLLLIFLVLHTAAFWAPNRYSQTIGQGELDLYEMMREAFQSGFVVAIYILGCIALSWHLVHGFFSAFQTLGLATNKYKSLIKTTGVAFAIIIPFIFIMMPLSFYFGWIS